MPFAGFYLRLLPTCFSHLMNFCLLFSCKLVTSFSMPRYCWFVNFSASWTFSFQVSICGLASRIFVLSLSASGSNPRPPSHFFLSTKIVGSSSFLPLPPVPFQLPFPKWPAPVPSRPFGPPLPPLGGMAPKRWRSLKLFAEPYAFQALPHSSKSVSCYWLELLLCAPVPCLCSCHHLFCFHLVVVFQLPDTCCVRAFSLGKPSRLKV